MARANIRTHASTVYLVILEACFADHTSKAVESAHRTREDAEAQRGRYQDADRYNGVANTVYWIKALPVT